MDCLWFYKKELYKATGINEILNECSFYLVNDYCNLKQCQDFVDLSLDLDWVDKIKNAKFLELSKKIKEKINEKTYM